MGHASRSPRVRIPSSTRSSAAFADVLVVRDGEAGSASSPRLTPCTTRTADIPLFLYSTPQARHSRSITSVSPASASPARAAAERQRHRHTFTLSASPSRCLRIPLSAHPHHGDRLRAVQDRHHVHLCRCGSMSAPCSRTWLRSSLRLLASSTRPCAATCNYAKIFRYPTDTVCLTIVCAVD
ncbi:hypothetical protein PLICRDRAFT_491395 [Plicaturopsis crispa FD-325 SS-3]|nr:hypothetical protein PLICRDRAFT_491395 [Plicaturopsis crispa FD-325 SS-3]